MVCLILNLYWINGNKRCIFLFFRVSVQDSSLLSHLSTHLLGIWKKSRTLLKTTLFPTSQLHTFIEGKACQNMRKSISFGMVIPGDMLFICLFVYSVLSSSVFSWFSFLKSRQIYNHINLFLRGNLPLLVLWNSRIKKSQIINYADIYPAMSSNKTK